MRGRVALAVVAALAPCVMSSGRGAALDPVFGSPATPGIVRFPGNAAQVHRRDGLAVFADGSIAVGNGNQIRKFTSSGAPDVSFGSTGVVDLLCAQASDLAVDSVGRLIVAITNGCTNPSALVFRYSSTGVLDATFNGSIPQTIFGATSIVTTTGGIVVASSRSVALFGADEPCLYRFKELDGAADPAFGAPATPGRACATTSLLTGPAVGTVLANGSFLLVYSEMSSISMVQFSQAGAALGAPVVLRGGTFSAVSDVEATPDGGFLLAGIDFDQGAPGSWVRRYNAAGQQDPTFNTSGAHPGMLRLDSGAADGWAMTPFPGGRFALVGSDGQTARAVLISVDGQTDAALESGTRTPGKLILSATPSSIPHISVFSAAAVRNGRLVVAGVEWDQPSGFAVQNAMAVVVRSDVVGPPAPTDVSLFRATPPTRLLDTRPGPDQVGYSGPKPAAGATFDVQIAGRAGMPVTGVGAVAMNLTATEATAPGFVTVWPSGGPRPVVSSLNLERAGQTLPNLVIVPVGADGRISMFTLSGTHLIADVLGWFPALGGVQTLVPTRILETRPGPGQTGYAGPKPAQGQTLSVQVAGRAGLPPTGVQVAIVNLTVTEADAAGFVAAWQSGARQPLVSNLNVSRAGQTIQNFAIVPLGDDGAFNLFTQSSAHLVVDLVGWLPQNSGYIPNPVALPRVLDTRIGAGVGVVTAGPIPAGGVVHVPGTANGIDLVDVVATNAAAPGYFTAYPSGVAQPLASNLNVEFAGQTIANSVLVTTDSSARFNVFTQSGADMIADLFGAFPLPT